MDENMCDVEMESVTMLCDLPDPILIKIFCYIPAKERMAVLPVCQKFYSLIAHEIPLMRDVQLTCELEKTLDLDDEFDVKDVEKMNRFIDCVNKSDRRYFNLKIQIDAPFFEPLVYVAIQRFKSLVELRLDVSSIELEDLAKIVNNLPDLVLLAVDVTEMNNTRRFTGKLECKKLRKLMLLNCDPIPKLRFKPKLFELEVNLGNNNNNRIIINKLLAEQKNLTYFHMTSGVIGKFLLNEEIFIKIMALPKLKKLKLSYFTYHDHNFDRKLSINNSLEVLKINIEHSVGAKSFMRDFIYKFPNLKEISLNYWIGGQFLWKGKELNFLSGVKNLEKLRIVTSYKESVLPHLVLKKLKEVTIAISNQRNANSENCSDEMIQFLQKHLLLEKLEIKDDLFQENTWIFIKEKLKKLKKFHFVLNIFTLGNNRLENDVTFLKNEISGDGWEFEITEPEKYKWEFIAVRR